MPANKLDLELGTTQGLAALDAMIAKARQLEEELSRVATKLGPSAMQDPGFRAGVQQLAQAQGAVTAAQSLQSSVTLGGAVGAAGIHTAMVAGANQATSMFGQIPTALGATAMVAAASQAGQMVQYTPSAPTGASFVAGVLAQSAMTSGAQGGGAPGLAVLGPNGQPYRSAVSGTGTMLAASAMLPQVAAYAAASNVMMSGISAQVAGGAAAMDPLLALGGMAGLNTMSQAQAAVRASGVPLGMNRQVSIGRAAVGAGALLASVQAVGFSAQAIASGDIDPMGAAQMWGGNTGAVVGGLAGALASPLAPGTGMAVGMLAGQQLGSAAAGWNIAPFMRTRSMAMTLASSASRQGLSPYDLILPGGASPAGARDFRQVSENTAPGMGGLSAIAEQIRMANKTPWEQALVQSGTYTGTDIISGPQLAQTYATISSALMSRGDDPSRAFQPAVNLAIKYGLNAPAMAQMAAPVFSARNRFGGNQADLALEFGPEAYGAYADAAGGRDLNAVQRSAIAGVQTGGYQAQLGRLQARGSGAAAETGYRSQMTAISLLPGGRDSLAYAEAGARARSSGLMAFEQQNLIDYGIPAAELEGMRAIAASSPYAPGNRMAIELSAIILNRTQMGRLDKFLNARRASGELSEEEEYDIRRQQISLQVQNARSVATLSEGVADRMPAMAAGRPAFAGRIDSMQMAAMNLFRVGSYRRDQGAANGSQLRHQDDLFRMAGMDPREGASWSRSSGIDFPGGSGGSGRMEELLAAILRELQGGNMRRSGRRPGEAMSSASGDLSGYTPQGQGGGDFN